MTSTPGDEQPQDNADNADTAPIPTPEPPASPSPGTGTSEPAGWQPQWQAQYPDPGQQGGQGGSQAPGYQAPGYPAPGYGQQYAPPPQGAYAYQVPDHPKATTAMVLGIVGLVLCQVLSPFAWVMGKTTLQEIDASAGRVGGRGQAQAGYVLGIVGTVLLGISIVVLVGYFIFIVGIIGAGIAGSNA